MSQGLDNHYREASSATAIGIGAMALLAVAKLLIGWWGRSAALVADGLHTVSDLASSLVVLVGLRIARRPADPSHPYGHGRAEGIAARSVAGILVLIAIAIAWEAVGELHSHQPSEPPSPLVPVAAAASILVNEVLFRYKRRVSQRTRSQAVLAEGRHHRSDAYSSIPVLVGTAAAVLGRGRWVLMDHVAALVVAGFILFAAATILKESWPEMLDASIDGDTVARLRELARSVAGVHDVEAVRGRQSGLGLLVELHVEVSPQMSVADSHRVAQRVRDALLASDERVSDAVIHIEPYYPDDH